MYELIRKHTGDTKESLLETENTLEEAKSKMRIYIAELPLDYVVKFSDRNRRADVWNSKKVYVMSFYIEKAGQHVG
jgi:hypothetical protein